jgi:hypothetical protein
MKDAEEQKKRTGEKADHLGRVITNSPKSEIFSALTQQNVRFLTKGSRTPAN